MFYAVFTGYNTHTKVKNKRHRKSEFGSSIIAHVDLSHSLTVLCQYLQWAGLNTVKGNQNISPQTISHVVTTENHLFRVKCDHVHGKFAYAINMYCEIVLNSS